MKNRPVVLGINRTQDGSMALLQGENALCCVQKERITHKKHHWGKLGDIPLYKNYSPSLNMPIDLVVEGYSSDKEIANLNEYHAEIKEHLNFTNSPNIIRISHHLSHAYSAFYPSPFKAAAVMVIDSVGSPVHDFTEEGYSSNVKTEGLFEVASFYRAENNKIKCIGKQLWDGNKSKPVGLGQFYHLLTQCLCPGEGNEGKVMGLAPYGNPETLKLPSLIVENFSVFIPKEWVDIFHHPEQFSFFINGSGTFQNAANLAAIGQAKFEEALLKISNFLHTQTNMNFLCYAGGCALNCMANGMLLKKSNFINMFVPPAPNDAGTALGCAIYGLVDILEYKPEFKWESDYLGEQSDISQSIKQIDLGDQLILEQPENLQETVANLLTQGNILALFQGRSEFGPRALGNRSIIADARYSVMTTWLNQSIKGREWYRPVAPLVLEEDLSIIFETEFPSPFMQFALPVKKEYQAIIPAGNHVNNTARLQTVSEKDNPFLYSLLHAFKCKTGVGALLNTSFNGRGETIVETLEEAISCFQNTSIHTLIAPPYIIRKNNPPPSPLLLASIYDISYNPQKKEKFKKVLSEIY